MKAPKNWIFNVRSPFSDLRLAIGIAMKSSQLYSGDKCTVNPGGEGRKATDFVPYLAKQWSEKGLKFWVMCKSSKKIGKMAFLSKVLVLTLLHRTP
jgi:hypothetical protein